MDYLTVIAARRLILFPIKPLNPIHHRTYSSPTSSPKSPNADIAAPSPIAMPIHHLIYHDTDCAYFLLQHVLDAHSRLGSVHRAFVNEAEVLVWKEIDRAKMFARGLGEWIKGSNGRIGERELRDLAEKFGLGIQDESGEEGDEVEVEEVVVAGEVERMESMVGSAILA